MASLRSLALRCAPRANLFSAAVAPGRTYATLLIAEHDNKALQKSTLQAVAAAAQLPGSDRLDCVVIGKGCKAVAEELAGVAGVSQVILAESDQLEHPVADTMTELLLAMQKDKGYSVIAGVASSTCKEALPRLAAKLDVQPIADVISVDGDDTFTRPMYAGNALSTVKSKDSVKVLTFRPTAFEEAGAAAAKAPIENMAAATYASAGITWVSDSEMASDKPQLSSAGRVVSGGRGLKSGENFTSVLEPLCDKLNAAMGASRAAVDAGFVPNELQVGQTGKVVAPELYIAVGISGAIQHLAGMKDSKTIVAINKDADAPIFQVADYGLVGDLFEKVPEMTGKL